MSKYLITTAIDYTNDVVHLGHSYQKVLADALTRYLRLAGNDVFFMTGTDEHGAKVEESATKVGLAPKEYVDAIVVKNQAQWKSLDIEYDRFMRTTDLDHKECVELFWKRATAKGDIYLGKFEGLYCLGCEEYKEEKDLVEGKCPMHPGKAIQNISEENYFFRFSRYQNALSELLRLHEDFVLPSNYQKEMSSFVKAGLKDIAISRSREKLKWGLPVPGNESQTIYVWFDALVNYYTAGSKEGYWEPNTCIIHILGKDNLRWHALLWSAMLISADLPLPTHILTHGFINLSGQKISKTLGNVILPSDMVAKYGSDAVRYYLLRYGPSGSDADLSLEKLRACYTSDLANDWGNLVSRISKLAHRESMTIPSPKYKFDSKYCELMNEFRPSQALELCFAWVGELNSEINRVEPWKLSGPTLQVFLQKCVEEIMRINFHLSPFLSKTSQTIDTQLQGNIHAVPPLFPRIS